MAVVWTVGMPLSFGFTNVISYLQYSSVKYLLIHSFIYLSPGLLLFAWLGG